MSVCSSPNADPPTRLPLDSAGYPGTVEPPRPQTWNAPDHVAGRSRYPLSGPDSSSVSRGQPTTWILLHRARRQVRRDPAEAQPELLELATVDLP